MKTTQVVFWIVVMTLIGLLVGVFVGLSLQSDAFSTVEASVGSEQPQVLLIPVPVVKTITNIVVEPDYVHIFYCPAPTNEPIIIEELPIPDVVDVDIKQDDKDDDVELGEPLPIPVPPVEPVDPIVPEEEVCKNGNPGNPKCKGKAGENPNGDGNWGGGSKGKSDAIKKAKPDNKTEKVDNPNKPVKVSNPNKKEK